MQRSIAIIILSLWISTFVNVYTEAQVTFRSVTSLDAPDTPYEMAKGDFNNDGRLDLITANFSGLTNEQVSLLINTGSGTFTGVNFRNFASGINALDVAVGDFNEDGNLDAVTCGQSGNQFSLLLGNGAGNLAAPVNFTAGNSPNGIAVGDMNKDGNLDVLMSHAGTPDDVYIFLGNGTGGFSAPITIPIATNTGWDITVGDFDGDSNPDFAISTAGVYTLQIWKGDGLATPGFVLFQTVTNFGINPDVDARDLDGDGDMDLLAGAAYTLNTAGVFGARILLPQTSEEYAVGDLNNDGKPDIAATDNSANYSNVRIFLGDGLGAFTLLGKFEAVMYARGLEMLDVNNDGHLDVVGAGTSSGEGKIDILLGDGTGYLTNSINKYPTPSNPLTIVKGDFNEDGLIDIALSHETSNIVSIYVGQGGEKFAKTASNYATGTLPFQIASIDYDNDTHLDIITLNSSSGNISILKGAGNGTFATQTPITVPAMSGSRMTIADFNNDTQPDIAVSGFTTNQINLLTGTGTGFNPPVSTATSENVSEIKAGDFNGDGNQDIAADFNNINRMVIFTGNGAGGFTEGATQYPHNTSFFLVNDLNGDTHEDIVAFSNSSTGDDYFINNGTGAFTGFDIPSSLGGFPWGYADMNSDGFNDLIVGSQNAASSQPGQILVFAGNATGISNTLLIDKDFSGGSRLVIHELNGDGKPDIISTSYYTGEDYLGVLINTTGAPACASPSITFLSTNLTLCSSNGATFSVTASGSSPITYQWRKAGVNIAGASNSTYSISSVVPSDAASYSVVVTNGCGSVTSGNILLTVNTTPVAPSIINAASCNPGTVTLTATGGSDGNYRWYTTSSGGSPVSGSVNGSFTTPLLTVSTTYFVSLVNGTCESNRTSVTATIGGTACTNQPPVISSSDNSAIADGSVTVNLNTLSSDPDNNLDLNSFLIVIPPQSGAFAQIMDGILLVNYAGSNFTGTDQLTIQVCDLLGSCVQQQLTIRVSDSNNGELIIHNGISPNGDGMNDFWEIEYIDVLADTKNNKVSLFNRWGDMVWKVNNYDNKEQVFKGLNKNGNEIPSGTYFYKIEFASGRKTQIGYISLKR